MTQLDLPRLERRARFVYEASRVGRALAVSWPVLPMTLLSVRGCEPVQVFLAAGLTLFVVATLLPWWRTAYVTPVLDGILAGVLPFAFPLVTRTLGPGFPGIPLMTACLAMAFAGGLVAGGLLGLRASRSRRLRSMVGVSMLIAALTGSLGCAIAGMSGVLGMALGLALGTAPVLALAGRSRW